MTIRFITLAERLSRIFNPEGTLKITECNEGELVPIGDGKKAIKRDGKYYRYFGNEKIEIEVDYNTGKPKSSPPKDDEIKNEEPKGSITF